VIMSNESLWLQIGGLSTKSQQALIERPAILACGKEHSAAISGRGQLFTWGLAANGELGRAEGCGTATPGPAYRAPASLVFVCAGGNHTLAISKVTSIHKSIIAGGHLLATEKGGSCSYWSAGFTPQALSDEMERWKVFVSTQRVERFTVRFSII